MKNSFPAAITELRKAKGLTQKQAAKALGISQSLLSHYENGLRECNLDFLIKISDFYDVTCDQILGHAVPTFQETKSLEDSSKIQSIYDSLEIMFDLVEHCNNESVSKEIADFINIAIYRIFRLVYFSGNNSGDGIFNLPKHTYRAMADAKMQVSEAEIRCALSGWDELGQLEPVFDKGALTVTKRELSALYGEKFDHLVELLNKAEEKIS